MTWPNGEAYEGEWLNEMRNGPKGKSTWNDGEMYDGDFKDNKFHGHGYMIYKDQVEYDGEWKDDMYHGKGVLK